MKKIIFLLFVPIFMGMGCAKKHIENNTQYDIIPNEVAHRKGYINYLTPPKDFNAVTGWITAIHNKNSSKPSFIEIDYIRLYARINGTDVLLHSNEYNDGVAEGGLYMRHPWFGTNDNTPIPYKFSKKENLVLKTSSKPNHVWHVWNKKWPRVKVPSNAERCWLEVRCKITGSALIQIGIDYWREANSEYAGYNVNNTEAGASDWYYESDEWIVLNFAKP